jgi:hypothetical protein
MGRKVDMARVRAMSVMREMEITWCGVLVRDLVAVSMFRSKTYQGMIIIIIMII